VSQNSDALTVDQGICGITGRASERRQRGRERDGVYSFLKIKKSTGRAAECCTLFYRAQCQGGFTERNGTADSLVSYILIGRAMINPYVSN